MEAKCLSAAGSQNRSPDKSVGNCCDVGVLEGVELDENPLLKEADHAGAGVVQRHRERKDETPYGHEGGQECGQSLSGCWV